jgi:hypothetical protein
VKKIVSRGRRRRGRRGDGGEQGEQKGTEGEGRGGKGREGKGREHKAVVFKLFNFLKKKPEETPSIYFIHQKKNPYFFLAHVLRREKKCKNKFLQTFKFGKNFA